MEEEETVSAENFEGDNRITSSDIPLNYDISQGFIPTTDSRELVKELDEGDEEEDEEEEEEEEVPFVPTIITEKHLKEIGYELGLIKLCWPSSTAVLPQNFSYPESYKTNTTKEKLLLLYAENFRRQFTNKYKNRKPLLLAADNECQLQKFVSTTIIPTKLVYPEFYTWEGCAKFVSDHISYEELSEEKPTFLPEKLYSPDIVMLTQRGTCFEVATLLVSLLIGAGYNAYVVSGYATAECCSNDLSRVNCPLLVEEVQKQEPPPPAAETKYVARPVRDLQSKFQLMMEERELTRIREEEQRLAEEERLRILELEKPDPDPLYGWRVHSWVLVLPGTREITEPFFIEPPSGIHSDLSNPNYLGIESIWNHLNYWINMQSCENGCGELNLDINNPTYWEHLLAGEPWDARVVGKDTFTFLDEKDFILQEKHLDMPFSWVRPITLSNARYEERYPKGSKVISYRKARCDLFAPYTHRDGLMWRVLTYKDYVGMSPESVVESFSFREDCLEKKIRYIEEEILIEQYRRGRDDALKVYKSTKIEKSEDSVREIDFYSEARFDGLLRVEMGPTHLNEYFRNREDKLLTRKCILRGPAAEESTRRVPLNVVEKFGRNPDIPADQDIATREFCVESNEIILKYHYAEYNLTSTVRRMCKPNALDLSERLVFNPELFSVYKPDPFAKPDLKIDLFTLMIDSLKAEEETLQHIRVMEDDILILVRSITFDQQQPKLLVSIFDEERNEEAKKGMKELERAMKERSVREVEADIDFLAPYLILKQDVKLSLEEATFIRDKCLEDYKDTLIARGNKIQTAFEKTAQELAEKEKSFSTEADNVTREMEDAYVEDVKRLIFLLNTLEIRLERHKVIAPQRYKDLEECLQNDPRLEIVYRSQKSERK